MDLATGAIDPHYFDAPSRVGTYAQGIDDSPAVHRDRVYISNVPGTLDCLHKSDVSLIWTTSLNTANQAANQPMTIPMRTAGRVRSWWVTTSTWVAAREREERSVSSTACTRIPGHVKGLLTACRAPVV